MDRNTIKISIKDLSDEQVLDLLYSEYMKIRPKNNKEFYIKSCLPHGVIFQKRFKMKYMEILIKAGIPVELLNISKPNEYYLDRLKELSERIGHTPSIRELKEAGFDQTIYVYRFGSYNKALEMIGLTPNKKIEKKKDITVKQIVKDYIELSDSLGRPATEKDFKNSNLSYSLRIVKLRLGSFGALRETAGYPKENRGGAKRKYTKDKILGILTNAYIQKGRPLTVKEIEQNKDLPSIPTITATFKTSQFSLIWQEVCIHALKELKRSKNNRDNDKVIAAGKKGEDNVAHNLSFLNKDEFIVYNNLIIHSRENGLTQEIDHLVIGPNGVLSLETKSYNGIIIVKSNNKWERILPNKDYKDILNPTQQVMRHENHLRSILPKDIDIQSIIVMGNYNTEVRNSKLSSYPIVNANEILQYIQNFNANKKLDIKQIKYIDGIIRDTIVEQKACINL